MTTKKGRPQAGKTQALPIQQVPKALHPLVQSQTRLNKAEDYANQAAAERKAAIRRAFANGASVQAITQAVHLSRQKVYRLLSD